jgi:hypothetical protein
MPNTTVFSTRCCARHEWRLRLFGGLLAVLLGLFGTAVLGADKPAVRGAELVATPHGYELAAAVDLPLNRTLEEALLKGINLHFLAELEITRPRGWYWFDEDIVEASRRMRVYYHLLLRRYVVEIAYVTRTVGTLDEALELLGNLQGWQVLERGQLKNGRSYDARLRVRLDTAQLPKPLQLGAVSGDRWALATPWYEWSFVTPVMEKTPQPAP